MVGDDSRVSGSNVVLIARSNIRTGKQNVRLQSSHDWSLGILQHCKYEAGYRKTEKDKFRKYTDGLNDELGPMFTAMEIKDFQILISRVTATKAKMKATERRKGGYRNDKKQKRDDRS
ncbi:hypothetical protein V6N13_040239 [Hibiscus sabdariffa]